MIKVVFLIPAFNEAATISNVVRECLNYGNVIVLDDGSTDATTQLAVKAGAEILQNKENIGYANTLMNGILSSKTKYDFIITIDADGEISPKIFDFTLSCEHHNKFFIGNRKTKNRNIESFLSHFSRYFFKIDDIFCGAYIIPTRLLEKLGSHPIKVDQALIGLKLLIHGAADETINIAFEPNKRVGESRFGTGFYSSLKLIVAFIRGILCVSNFKKNS